MAKRLFFLVLATLLLAPNILSDNRGYDFFFLVESARLLLEGASPYTDELSWKIYGVVCKECAISGFAYPLPVLLLVLPFVWLPNIVGVILFSAISVALIVWCLDRLNVPPVALLFAPPAWAALYGNPTLLITGLILLGIVMMQRQSWRMLGLVTVVLLAVKPQTALVFAIYFLWQLWRARRIHYALVPGIGLLLASLAVLPTWPLEWFTQLSTYQDSQLMYFPWYLAPIALYLLYKGQRYPGLALLQAALPANGGIYVFSPLLAAPVGHPYLVWPLLAGSACSYIVYYMYPDYYIPGPFLFPIAIMFLLSPILIKDKQDQAGTTRQSSDDQLELAQQNKI
jgi:hypothetical protein